MAGVFAGFATGAATSALALSALSLLTSEGLPGPNPPGAPAEELSVTARPAPPDAPAAAPTGADRNPFVRPGSGTGDAAGPEAATAPAGAGEPAALPQASFEVDAPVGPGSEGSGDAVQPASADPDVTMRAAPGLEAPGRGRVADTEEVEDAEGPGPRPRSVAPTAAPEPRAEPDERGALPQPEPVQTARASLPVPSVGAPGAAVVRPEAAAPAPMPDTRPAGVVAVSPGALPDDAAGLVVLPDGDAPQGFDRADIAVVRPAPPAPVPDRAARVSAAPQGQAAEVVPKGAEGDGRAAPDLAAAPDAASGEEVAAGTAVQFQRVEETSSGDQTGGVVTNRLPQIGEAEPQPDEPDDPAEEAAEESAETDAPEDAGPPETGALSANAAAFEADGDRPALGLLLRDAAPRPTAEELAALTLPVTFAVNVSAPDAAEAIAHYREAGFEVALAADLPNGAQAADAETSVEAWLGRHPGAVAFVEATEGGLQGSRETVRGVLARLAESGHGLIAYPRGLNAAMQVAGSEGVPAALVFRDLDGPESVVRQMDQAAFRATREPGVLVVGDATPEIVAALKEWASSPAGGRVQAAPVSHVLRAGPGS